MRGLRDVIKTTFDVTFNPPGAVFKFGENKSERGMATTVRS